MNINTLKKVVDGGKNFLARDVTHHAIWNLNSEADCQNTKYKTFIWRNDK